MPKRTPEATRQEIVRLRKEGKTYTQIERAVGVTRPVVARTLKEAGLTGKQSSGGGASPTPSATPSDESSPPSGTAEFQPPPPKEAKPTTPKNDEVYACGACTAQFVLDEGESLADVTCPSCGVFLGDAD